MENIYNAIQNVYNMDKTTWQEVLAELYNLVSNVENKFDLFENKFGQLLGEEVTRELKKMYDDGSLATLINDNLLKDIKTIVDAFKTEVNEQLDTKANLNSVFSMTNMGQDVKEAMTGGSVAVVGRNAILTENIIDNQVTPEKLSIFDKTKDNLWVIDNASYKGMTVNYSYDDFSTKFKGEFIEKSRMLIKTVYLSNGTWSIKGFELTGNKPTIYIYKLEDYLKANWLENIGTLSRASNSTDITIESDGDYCLVIYGNPGEVYDSNGKFVLSKNNSANVTSYIPIKYRFKGYIEPDNKITLFEGLKNKKLSILGVSIDTYTGYIPSGNSSYYRPSNLDSVELTWWKKLLNKTGMVLETNNSWSGACAATKKDLASSGVQRCTNLGDNPNFIIISAFALNDWSNSNLTKYNKDTMVIPNKDVDLKVQSNYDTYKTTIESYGGAMATIFYRIMEKYHNSKIFVCDAYNYYRNGAVPFTPSIDEPKINICNEILYDVARQFGIEVIRISECGINAFNALEYTVDGKSTGSIGLHPDDSGHTLYFNKVLEYFNKYI